MDHENRGSDFPGGPEDRVEPGSPVAENAAVVLLGALSALAVVLHLVGLL